MDGYVVRVMNDKRIKKLSHRMSYVLRHGAGKLGVPMEKMISNLDEYGNTSAGSIPLALDEAVKSGKVQPGDVIACAGFGAGLSWGAAVIRWDYEFAG